MKKFLIGLVLGVLIGLGIGFLVYKPIENVVTNESEEIVTDSVTVKLEQPEFFLEDKPTVELVLQACEYYNIQHPDIVVAQAILETGHFRSENCIKKNNLFGLYNSYKHEFFEFDHWSESVKAYHNLIQYRYTEGDYFKWLEKIGYAEDTLYVSKVKSIKEQYIEMV